MRSILFLFVLSISTRRALSTCVVVEYECRSGGTDYTQANRDDCSRFVYCSFGKASYWQCRRGSVFDFCRQLFWACIPVTSNNPRYECFNATNTQCVVQKERPFDPLQPSTEVYNVVEAPTTPPTTTTTTQKIPVIPPFLPGILPGAPYPPMPISPYNPYLYGPGLGVSSGGMGFNMNLNYNPLLGWGLNSNLAVETPWATMLAPLLGLPPIPPLDPYSAGIGMPFGGLPGMPFPPMFRQFSPTRRVRQFAPIGRMLARRLNAVEVNACVPVDPYDSNTTPITTPKINETFS